MQRSKPFARALAIAAALAASAGASAARTLPIPAEFHEYKSRGKGKGLHSGKKWGPRPSYKDMVQHPNGLWYQKENGAREVARRVRQAERNALKASARLGAA